MNQQNQKYAEYQTPPEETNRCMLVLPPSPPKASSLPLVVQYCCAQSKAKTKADFTHASVKHQYLTPSDGNKLVVGCLSA